MCLKIILQCWLQIINSSFSCVCFRCLSPRSAYFYEFPPAGKSAIRIFSIQTRFLLVLTVRGKTVALNIYL